MYQHGDVLLKRASLNDLVLNEIKTDILHQGLNHEHRVKGDFNIIRSGDDVYLQANKNCVLYHQEHSEIEIESGVYKKSIVKEYDHWEEESREVID